MKQQEEIERMRTTTLRLKERLKCAGGEVPSVSNSLKQEKNPICTVTIFL